MNANRTRPSTALFVMSAVVVTSFVVAVLYVGKDVLVPLALAGLLTFLLAPLVSRLERWIGRALAVILVATIVCAGVTGVGYVLTRQIIQLAQDVPQYKENIREKLRSLRGPGASPFTEFNKTVEDLSKELPLLAEDQPVPEGATPADGVVTAVPQRPVKGGLDKKPASGQLPVPVEVVESKKAGPLNQFSPLISGLIGPIGTAALVLLLLVCMLLKRENLRGRLIRLVGAGNISATTRGLDDASQRVSRYLFMQLIVNATYGLVVGLGLFLIGVPGAFVWGVLATVLRFIPYVGAWIAAACPIILSLTVGSGWEVTAYTIMLFVVLELLSNNVMEPLLYRNSTGVSSIALIVTAVFWTWLWGAAGLVLATPLTVCLVVMGRHIPRLGILSVLLSDEDALAPHEEFYHRLLTADANDLGEFVQTYLKDKPITTLYDEVIIPVVGVVERDWKAREIDSLQHGAILQEISDILEDTEALQSAASKEETDKIVAVAGGEPSMPPSTCRVVCVPARAQRDELVGKMLTQLLEQQGFPASGLSYNLKLEEMLQAIAEEGAEALCISVMPPSTIFHARYLCNKIRNRFPDIYIVVGLWGASASLANSKSRLVDSGASVVVATLAEAVLHLSQHAEKFKRRSAEGSPARKTAHPFVNLSDPRWLEAKSSPALDKITKKLAHVFVVPTSAINLIDDTQQIFLAQHGLPEELARTRETPLDMSFFTQVVTSGEVVVIEDLSRDRHFSKGPLVTEHGLRFYAGAPLRTSDGKVLGAICVMDTKPRKLSEVDKRLLQVIADEAAEVIGSMKLSSSST